MELNANQTDAICSRQSTVLTIAGAGSGKTLVAVERIVHLIRERQVAPSEIMAITFTRNAADELRTRITSSLTDIDIDGMVIGTIHSIALMFLNRYAEEIGYRQGRVTVYNPWAEARLIKKVATDIGVYKRTWKIPKRKIDKAFLLFYTTGIRPSETAPEHSLFEMVMQYCRENNAMTYGMLLVELLDILQLALKDFPLRHIIVDEVQDIDIIQWEIIEKLRMFGNNVNLFAIGDYNQSIYSFRGATPSEMFARAAGGQMITMDVNYRSVPDIVNASMSMINDGMRNRAAKAIAHRSGEEGGVSIVYDCDTSAIVDLIATQNTPGNRIGVLARNHSFLIKLSEMLREANIDHYYPRNDDKIRDTQPFQVAHAFLSLLVNPHDAFSFDVFAEGIGMSSNAIIDMEINTISNGQASFVSLSESQPYIASLDADTLVCDALDALSSQYPAMADDIDSVRQYIVDTYGNLSVRNYIMAFDHFDSDAQQDHDISLMTIHAAKGKQWPTVIVIGCNEGIIPSWQSIKSGSVDEEQRLMYVAMTRAQDRLILTVRPEHTFSRGREYHNPTSRFIQSIESKVNP